MTVRTLAEPLPGLAARGGGLRSGGMPMTADPLLQAVLAEPQDDALRLVYADWLEEHGDPDRAELIRLQCELARLEPSDRRGQRLRRRERALLREHGKEWAGPLGRLKCSPYLGWRRGFVDSVREVEAQEFLDHLPAFFERHPLRVVEVRRARPGQ